MEKQTLKRLHDLASAESLVAYKNAWIFQVVDRENKSITINLKEALNQLCMFLDFDLNNNNTYWIDIYNKLLEESKGTKRNTVLSSNYDSINARYSE